MFYDIIIGLFGVIVLGTIAWVLLWFLRVSFTEFMSENPTNVRASVLIIVIFFLCLYLFVFPIENR